MRNKPDASSTRVIVYLLFRRMNTEADEYHRGEELGMPFFGLDIRALRKILKDWKMGWRTGTAGMVVTRLRNAAKRASRRPPLQPKSDSISPMLHLVGCCYALGLHVSEADIPCGRNARYLSRVHRDGLGGCDKATVVASPAVSCRY